ncbi:MAG: diaminopropionate ammonia-lyase [Chthoniobacterales bacterium]
MSTNEQERARVFFNSAARDFVTAPSDRTPLAFHQRLPGYAPTPLRDVPELARLLRVGEVLVKDESSRLGLPAFKILGASWAIYRTLQARNAIRAEGWQTIAELAAQLQPLAPMTLAAATDGNHGRAVAHLAAFLGFSARIYVPAGTAQSRIDGIASEGARVIIVEGTYDEAVARAAEDAGERCLIISDTSWPGYEEVPRWVAEGYSTIFWEIDDELARRGLAGPDLVAVQCGVGALAAAFVRHYRQTEHARPLIVNVEPLRAACVLASMEAGEIVSVPGPHDSIMAGLNCGRPSIIAWPIISAGIDAFVAIPDERAREAMRALARIGIVAGETGAAGLAGLSEILAGENCAQDRARLGVHGNSRVLLLITEGATDPAAYREIVARDIACRAEGLA